MSTAVEIFKCAATTHNGVSYVLNKVGEDLEAPKNKTRQEIMLRSNETPNRKILFITESNDAGHARVVSTEGGKLFTQSEAEMLRSKGFVKIPRCLVK